MDVIISKVSDLTKVQYRACYLANYGSYGFMREYLVSGRVGGGAHAILLWDGPPNHISSLIGWSLVQELSDGEASPYTSRDGRPSHLAMFWVKRPYRRRGHGKTLTSLVHQHFTKNPAVEPHDLPSARLFSGYRCSMPPDTVDVWAPYLDRHRVPV